MKIRKIPILLFLLTGAAVMMYPLQATHGPAEDPPDGIQAVVVVPGEKPRVEVVFVLDTTGSMGGLINAAKQNIWSIASTLASAQPTPEIKIGLVAYRDRGDDYVTRVIDLSADLDTFHAKLMDLQAQGGGDGPESVNRALYDAVHAISWSEDPDSYRAVFLVGDAPAHTDYAGEPQFPEIVNLAYGKGIVVNTIQCGHHPVTTRQWKHIAQSNQGRFFQVEQNGSAIAVTTPFDDEMARLSMALDDTRLYYGSAEQKAAKASKRAATAKLHELASPQSRARRAAFIAQDRSESNWLGDQDLVKDVAEGRVDLSSLPATAMPESLEDLPVEEREQLVAHTYERRATLKRQIKELAGKRDAYVAAQVSTHGGDADSLDQKIYGAIQAQAESKGLRYEDGPDY